MRFQQGSPSVHFLTELLSLQHQLGEARIQQHGARESKEARKYTSDHLVVLMDRETQLNPENINIKNKLTATLRLTPVSQLYIYTRQKVSNHKTFQITCHSFYSNLQHKIELSTKGWPFPKI